MQFLKKYSKPLVLLIAVCAIMVLDRIYGWSDYLGDMENFRFLLDTVRSNLLEALLIYCVLTIIGCVVLALPGITFAVLRHSWWADFSCRIPSSRWL